MSEQIAALLISAGPVGVFCLYLIWRAERDAKATAAERKERLDVDRDRIATDKDLAAGIARLATLVEVLAR